jgi:adhesin HecA-like repeat protein
MVATILILSMVLAIAGVIVALVMNNARAVSGFSDYQEADNIATVGLEKAIYDLRNDPNWSDNNGSTTESYLEGTLTLTRSDGSTDNITIVSTGIHKDNRVIRQKRLLRTNSAAHNVDLTTSSSFLSTNSSILNQLLISNTGTSNVRISSIILSWTPATTPNSVTNVAINGVTQWSAAPSNTPHTAGAVLTLNSPYLLNTGATSIPLDITFAQNMSGKTLSIVLQFDDGSSISSTHTPDTSTAATMLDVDVTDAEIKGPRKKDIEKIFITNTDSVQSLSIVSITSRWVYDDPVNRLERIRLDNTTIWNGNDYSNDTQTWASPKTLAPGATKEIELRFNTNIQYSRIELQFNMSDGSNRSAFIDFRINQADYLTVNTSLATIQSNKLLNLSINNSHAEAKIWLSSMQIAVYPNTAQTVEGITLGSSTLFGPSNSPKTLNTTLTLPTTEINTSATDQDITFSTLASLHDFAITYTMRDGSSKTVTRNFASDGPAADSIAVNTQNVILNTGLETVSNLAVSRNGTAAITFQQMTVSWAPIGSVKLKEITIDGTRLFNNSSGVSSGTTVTLSSAKTLSNSDSNILLKFSNDLPNTDISIAIICSDGSQKSFTAFLNPGNNSVWAAGDNFEANQGISGGAGFASNWVLSDSTNNTFKTGGNSYSGNRHMQIRQQNTASRTLTNAATKSSQKVTYVLRLGSYDNGEAGSVQIRKGGTGAWTTIRTIERPTYANSTFYKFTDTVSMTIGQKFEIQFKGGASNNNEYMYIDELFFEK